jgi:hypothetical protein
MGSVLILIKLPDIGESEFAAGTVRSDETLVNGRWVGTLRLVEEDGLRCLVVVEFR